MLVEQFRPGVMKRLGLDWDTLKKINKKLVYCSITGYGQSGPKKLVAGHDINYLAESGLLSLSTDKNGTPILPNTQIADIAGGSYPAFMNILLGLFIIFGKNSLHSSPIPSFHVSILLTGVSSGTKRTSNKGVIKVLSPSFETRRIVGRLKSI